MAMHAWRLDAELAHLERFRRWLREAERRGGSSRYLLDAAGELTSSLVLAGAPADIIEGSRRLVERAMSLPRASLD